MADVQNLIDAFRSNSDGPETELILPELVDGGFVIPDDVSVVADVIQIDPADSITGAVRGFYLFGDGVFKFDATDETTAHDGITCLVLIGGRRYKLLGDIRIKAVEAVGIDAEPTPTEFGQAWIDLTGVVGDSNQIIIWTSRGWVPQDPDYGPPIYVKTATDGYLAKSYIHWDEGDGWVAGVGSGAYQTSSIPLSAEIWDHRVQNQTTNTQPTTISKGVAHIIGSSPTGAKWAGNAGKLSISETDNDVTVYTPWIGLTVYNIDLHINVSWNGSAWLSASGSIVGYSPAQNTSSTGSTTDNGSGNYSFSYTTAPTTSNRRRTDDVSIAYAAKVANAPLRIYYRAYVVAGGGAVDGDNFVIAIYRGSESNAIAWFPFTLVAGVLDPVAAGISLDFNITAPDTASYTYKAAALIISGTGVISTLGRRSISLDEYSL